MKTKDMVEVILQDYPLTRNNDKYLFIRIVDVFYSDLIGEFDSILLSDLFRLPSYDLVSRWRRKFQEQGLYLPSIEKVKKQRQAHQKKIKEELGYMTQELRTTEIVINKILNRILQDD